MADKEKDDFTLMFLNGAKMLADKHGWKIRDIDLEDLWIDFDCEEDEELYFKLGEDITNLAESLYQQQIRKLFKI